MAECVLRSGLAAGLATPSPPETEERDEVARRCQQANPDDWRAVGVVEALRRSDAPRSRLRSQDRCRIGNCNTVVVVRETPSRPLDDLWRRGANGIRGRAEHGVGLVEVGRGVGPECVQRPDVGERVVPDRNLRAKVHSNRPDDRPPSSLASGARSPRRPGSPSMSHCQPHHAIVHPRIEQIAIARVDLRSCDRPGAE